MGITLSLVFTQAGRIQKLETKLAKFERHQRWWHTYDAVLGGLAAREEINESLRELAKAEANAAHGEL